MPQVIKPKRSFTPGSVPTISDLVEGEIAINTADENIYMRDDSDTIKKVGGAQSPLDEDLDANGFEIKDTTGATNLGTPYLNGLQFNGTAFSPIYTKPYPKFSTWSYAVADQFTVLEWTTEQNKLLWRLNAINTTFIDATALVNGDDYIVHTEGTSDFTAVGSSSNDVGTEFTATGSTTGDGICIKSDYDDGDHDTWFQLYGNNTHVLAKNKTNAYTDMHLQGSSISLSTSNEVALTVKEGALTGDIVELKKPIDLPKMDGVGGAGVPNMIIDADQCVVGKRYMISTVGDTDWVSMGAASDTYRVIFTCTVTGSGTGKCNVGDDYFGLMAYNSSSKRLTMYNEFDPYPTGSETIFGWEEFESRLA